MNGISKQSPRTFTYQPTNQSAQIQIKENAINNYADLADAFYKIAVLLKEKDEKIMYLESANSKLRQQIQSLLIHDSDKKNNGLGMAHLMDNSDFKAKSYTGPEYINNLTKVNDDFSGLNLYQKEANPYIKIIDVNQDNFDRANSFNDNNISNRLVGSKLTFNSEFNVCNLNNTQQFHSPFSSRRKNTPMAYESVTDKYKSRIPNVEIEIQKVDFVNNKVKTAPNEDNNTLRQDILMLGKGQMNTGNVQLGGRNKNSFKKITPNRAPKIYKPIIANEKNNSNMKNSQKVVSQNNQGIVNEEEKSKNEIKYFLKEVKNKLSVSAFNQFIKAVKLLSKNNSKSNRTQVIESVRLMFGEKNDDLFQRFQVILGTKNKIM